MNNWDSNAKKGTPSIGLTQMIEPTFRAYALPGHKDIRNPVDNLIASSRYCDARYGSMDNMAAARGYGAYWRGY
ncbi:transglycosylase SLT domain-containing protein [Kitasatospora cheerisanensis]|uniref:transglycosylase SLT domain-containing protein n=1 Tax=Kitasatospora cheerisanensis TaxID=81942 RepID=UPI001FCB7434|nr:transglycosylase SLT domain-containing protein [Kitasatospora cheerisanensis]